MSKVIKNKKTKVKRAAAATAAAEAVAAAAAAAPVGKTNGVSADAAVKTREWQ